MTPPLQLLRCNGHLFDDNQPAIAAWVTSLGVDPATVRREFVVLDNDGQYELHLSQYVENENGRRFADFVTNEAVSRPLVVPLDTPAERTCKISLDDALQLGRGTT